MKQEGIRSRENRVASRKKKPTTKTELLEERVEYKKLQTIKKIRKINFFLVLVPYLKKSIFNFYLQGNY